MNTYGCFFDEKLLEVAVSFGVDDHFGGFYDKGLESLITVEVCKKMFENL